VCQSGWPGISLFSPAPLRGDVACPVRRSPSGIPEALLWVGGSMNALFVKDLAPKRLVHPQRDCRLHAERTACRDDAHEEADSQHERGVGKQHRDLLEREPGREVVATHERSRGGPALTTLRNRP
jgi:hypothetical protein